MTTRRAVQLRNVGTHELCEPEEFTLDHVRALLRAMAGSEVASIRWERDDQRLLIDRGQAQLPTAPAAPYLVVPAAPPTFGLGAAAVDAAPPPVAPPPARAAEKPGVLVRTPLVGTFYRAPAPDAAPFVEVGAAVKRGQVLCIVEAMKVMNEIEAEAPGRVAEILVANATSVDQDQPLFRIEPV